jgi:hypothetical protein
VLLSIGTKGQKGPDGQPFNMPTHAVEAPNGDIFISDGYGQNLIHHFSAKGEHLLTFGGGDSVFIPKRFNLGPVTGRPGTDPCQFNVPHELLVTADNLVYVMDRENHRWQVFTTDGVFVSLQERVSHPNRVALDGGRGVKRRVSSSPAASMVPGWTPTAPSTRPKPAATTASRSSSASDLYCGRRMRRTLSAAPVPFPFSYRARCRGCPPRPLHTPLPRSSQVERDRCEAGDGMHRESGRG